MSRHIRKTSRVFRVELELRPRFLKLYGIKDPYDFGKLVEILPKRHIHFVRINERKLAARLRRMGFSARRVWEILDDVRLLEGDVWATLNFLRQEIGMKNSQRLLESLRTNGLIVEALKRWAARWPTAPMKLRHE